MVYLLRFSHPLGDPNRPGAHASYYLGWTPDHLLDRRLAEHRAGRGARITAAAVARGLHIELVRTWPGAGREYERKLKRAGHFVRHDPAPPPHVPLTLRDEPAPYAGHGRASGRFVPGRLSP